MYRIPTKAFTLIEVLVVVAIIALLVSILLPSLVAARAQAKSVVCATNVRSLVHGHLLYSESYKGVLPHYDHWLWDSDWQWWAHPDRGPLCPRSGELFGERYDDSMNLIGRGTNYINFVEVFLCPMDSLERRDLPAHNNKPIRPPSFSYSRNEMLYETMRDRGKISKKEHDSGYYRHGAIREPARTPLLVEEHELGPMNDGYLTYCDWDHLTLRHKKRAMVGYYDGHAGRIDAVKYNNGSKADRARMVAPGI